MATLPGVKVWENTVPLTTAASPLTTGWFDTTGWTSVLLAWVFTTGVTTLTMQGSFDGATQDTTMPYPAIPALIPVTPSTPATGVAVQNPNSYPVQVVIGANGATITNVSVSGVTVGTAAGTYVVPPYGSISIAYSVATPTMAWTAIPSVQTVTMRVMHTFVRFNITQSGSNATVTTVYAQAVA